MREPSGGKLVAVVGIDGAGKTTQVRDLAEWFAGQGVPAHCVLNQTLLPVRRALDAIAREEGFTDHLEMVGAPAIRLISACSKLVTLAQLDRTMAEPGSVTFVDRYTACQYAAVRLQGADNEQFLRRLNRFLPEPDLTILLDVDPEVARDRIERRGIDSETLDMLTRYRECYRSLPEHADFVVVDGNGDRAAVQHALRAAVAAVVAVPGAPARPRTATRHGARPA